MSASLRIVDSGIREPRANLSLTEALARGRRAGTTPDTFRFQHFPPCAIVGRHQILAREVDLDWCRAHGVATARRMTGGGAIVMGPGLLGWELILSRALVPDNLGEVSAKLCSAVAAGLSSFGIAAAYRPRNDVEVNGRKVSGTGGYFDGAVLVFQGTVLIELDIAFMTNALNLPIRKLGKRGLEAFAERVCDLRELLGTAPPVGAVEAALARSVGAALGLAPLPGGLMAAEEALAREIHAAEIGRDAFVEGHDDAFPAAGRIVSHAAQTPGGMVEVALKLRDGAGAVIDQAVISGDYFAAPPRIAADLEAHLRQVPAAQAAQAASAFLAASGARFLGMEPAEIVAIVAEAARQAGGDGAP